MTSAPVVTPVVRVAVPNAAPVVFVPVQASSAVVRVQSLGTQGPRGLQGPQGVPGDYGSIRYDEVNATPITLTPNVPTAFTLAAPVMTVSSLRGPFADFVFLLADGRTLRARANGDTYLIRARMSVVTSIAGGSFTTDLVIPSVSGPSSTRPRSLMKPAGTSELIDELFQAFPGSGFIANGASIMLTSTVPAVVIPQTMFVTPLGAV